MNSPQKAIGFRTFFNKFIVLTTATT